MRPASRLPATARFPPAIPAVQRVDQAVEHADQVVLRVVERPRRDCARIAEDVPGLLGHEPEGIAQHLGQVVAHQQRFLLVHRQARVPLSGAAATGGCAPSSRACAASSSAHCSYTPSARILQVDRLDARPDTGTRPGPARQSLQRGYPTMLVSPRARPSGVDPIEIDEGHRLARAVQIGHAGP